MSQKILAKIQPYKLRLCKFNQIKQPLFIGRRFQWNTDQWTTQSDLKVGYS